MSHWEKAGRSNEWYTPKYVFDALGCVFDMDVAAPEDRSRCRVPAIHFITEKSLDAEWKGFVWCNPPFGKRNGIMPWIDKMVVHRPGGIILTPDRTSAPWWQAAAEHFDAVLFVSPKIKFIRPNGYEGESPSTGTSLFAIGNQGVQALQRASQNNLGVFYGRMQ
jgi:hypothetical protein